MGRPLLYGPNNEVVASQAVMNERAQEVLVEAFGFVTGLTIGRCSDPTSVQLLMDEARQNIIKGVLAIEGMADAIGERYDLVVFIDPQSGELIVRSKEPLARPPGQPRGPGGG